MIWGYPYFWKHPFQDFLLQLLCLSSGALAESLFLFSELSFLAENVMSPLAVLPLFEPIPSSERDSISTEFYSPKNPGTSQGRDCTDRILLGWDWNPQSLGMGLDS